MRRILLAVVVLVVVLASTTAAAVYRLLSGDGIRAALERQATAWLGQPVRIGSADAQLFPRIGVQLTDVHVGDPARVTLGSVEVSTGLRALLSRRIENADVILANSRIDMPLPFELPTSGSTGEEPDWQIVSMRTIRLDDVVVSSRGREVTVSVDSSLAGDTLALTRIRASASGTTVDGSGAVRLAPALDARLDLSANTLDLDDLLALAEAFAPGGGGRRTASSADGRLVAEVRADSVTAGRLTVPQFSTTVRVHGTRVSLSPTRFLLFGGRYEGDLDLALSEAGAMTLVSRVRDINVAELAAFGGVPDAITGRLSGSGRFEGRGTALAEVMATARGGGSATIADGSIRGLNLVRTVVLFLGRPAPDTAAATDSFDRIDTTFSLASQVVTADALSLQSRDADIVATGTLALETKALDGRADLSLSEELSKQAGTDLYRYTREGNRIVLPATIGGTLGAPLTCPR